MNVRDLIRAAIQHDATVEQDEGGRTVAYQVLAPDERQWIDGGCHALRVEWNDGDRAHQDESIRDAIERINLGLRECPADCDCRG